MRWRAPPLRYVLYLVLIVACVGGAYLLVREKENDDPYRLGRYMVWGEEDASGRSHRLHLKLERDGRFTFFRAIDSPGDARGTTWWWGGTWGRGDGVVELTVRSIRGPWQRPREEAFLPEARRPAPVRRILLRERGSLLELDDAELSGGPRPILLFDAPPGWPARQPDYSGMVEILKEQRAGK